QLGTRRRLAAPVARWHRMPQHLGHRLRVDAEPPRRLALAQALDMAGVANPRVQVHWLHPHPSGRPSWPEDMKATNCDAALAGHAPGRFSDGFSLRRSPIPRQGATHLRTYLYEAANTVLTRSRGDTALKRWGFGLKARLGHKK